MNAARRHHRRAFTLVEAISTITILSILGAVGSRLMIQTVDGYVGATVANQLQSEATVAMDRMARELRMIDLDTSASGIAPDITGVGPSSITWSTTGSISVVSGELRFIEESGGQSGVLLDDVSAFSIATFDESGAALPSALVGSACDPIRRIRLSVTITRNGVSRTVATDVFIRSTITGAGS